MPLPESIRTLIQRETDAHCIDRARKRVRYMQKWGRWAAASFSTIGILALASAVLVVFCVQSFAHLNAKVQNPAAPQPRNMDWLGFSIGLILGSISGFLLVKGMHYLGQGIEFLRGDRVYELLIRYHDAIMAMIQSEHQDLASTATGQEPQSPTSPDQPDG